MKQVGTFDIKGNEKIGYWLIDRCSFNNWGVRKDPKTGQNFKTNEEAADYGQRIHDFKTGRRMTV